MINLADAEYLSVVEHVLAEGVYKPNRTGINTLSTFGQTMRFDLQYRQIPMLTTKKMFTRGIIHELLWFLSGSENINYLKKNNVKIWDAWAGDNGYVGPVYGAQWRNWMGIDQLAKVIHTLKTDPNDRRMIVNSWNVFHLDKMALPPCPYSFQFYTQDQEECDRLGLSCLVTQRSADLGLGVPFDIVQYAMLTHMIAQVCNMDAVELIWNGADVHIYENHVHQLEAQLDNKHYPSPTLRLDPSIRNIDDFTFDSFEIENYQSCDTIQMDVAV